MGTTLHTFMNIFGETFESSGEPIELKKIVIPIIQRDYAQGRVGQDTNRVRKRFLDALYKAVTETPITLDFVYGDIDINGIMTPLDGQQRLTTLFLLHWYAAKRCGIGSTEIEFLNNFSYETRYSARDFCSYLINFEPSFTESLKDEIIDQAWFPLDWKNDPTIMAMLVMLDSIDEKFKGVNNLWDLLHKGAITFYFLPIKDMGLTDDLYIKMNSRGKPLTLFEHFKAELEHELNEVNPDVSKHIIEKIDLSWTEMLWRYRGDDNIIDDEFLRYFHFICDILYYKKGDTPQGKSNDEFDLIKTFFSSQSEDVNDNIKLLEDYFECWCGFDNDNNPASFFDSFSSKEHMSGKIKVENRYLIDVFEDCLRNNSGLTSNGNRAFALNRIVFLYAVVTYLLNKESITFEKFVRRIRSVNNLIRNSEDEISDSVTRQGGNRMPNILKQVDSIIINGVVDLDIERNFNVPQLKEEKDKIEWLENNKEYEDELFELEDNDLLYGQIGVVGLEHPEYFKRFINMFSGCDWDKIDCALMASGNYIQKEKNNWRFQLGARSNVKAWRTLFHRSASQGFDNTKNCLSKVLSSSDVITNEVLTRIKDEFISDREYRKYYDWRYYYVKYGVFRAGRFGKYTWKDFDNRPYEFAAMYTEKSYSTNMYQPFLKEVDPQHISRDDFGMRLLYDDYYVVCENDAYVAYKLNTDKPEEEFRITIEQTDGIDSVDRIKKYTEHFGIEIAEEVSQDKDIRDVEFRLTIRGADAVGHEDGKKFLVKKGSIISSAVTPSLADIYREQREQLIQDGIIKDNVFMDDYLFTTISAAACVVSGRSANGKTEWIDKDGKTYQEIKEDL